MSVVLSFALEDAVDDGNHISCVGCGQSNITSNPNTKVKYEDKLILVEGCIFAPHPNVVMSGRTDCCKAPEPHGRSPEPESSLALPPQTTFITIDGKLPIRLGDLFPCGSKVIKLISDPFADN
jgi:hypothetical protein